MEVERSWTPRAPELANGRVGGILEITPEHIAWVRIGDKGDIPEGDYCGAPRLDTAGKRARSLALKALAAASSAASVPVAKVWEVRCSDRSGFGGVDLRGVEPFPLILLSDGRLALPESAEEVTVLRPVQAGSPPAL